MPPDLLADLGALVAERHRARDRLLVCVDGPDAAGKTTLAARLLESLPGQAIGASVDGFQRPRAERYARGELSPEACYRDTFDVGALVGQLLEPFRAGASEVRTQVWDYRTDAPAVTTRTGVPPRAVLVVDGVFLQRPELRSWWDLAVYLDVPDDELTRRAVVRDAELFGDATRERFAQKYLPAQVLYRADADPVMRADVVVDNADPLAPVVRRWPAS